MKQTNTPPRTREVTQITEGVETSDGDGVNMTRLIATQQLSDLDPFLLLDAFGSDEPGDYLGGFPSHPHRGFETVTYLLAGRMRHKDSAGNEGVIEAGGVQWMTAGKGIVHSEMPEQENGLLQGFQLWVNLPAKAKMTLPGYQEFGAAAIPVEQHPDGTEIRVITGKTDQGTVGPVKNTYVKPLYMDVTLPAGIPFQQTLNAADNSFIYVIEGQIQTGENAHTVTAKQLAILEPTNNEKGRVKVIATEEAARFLLVSGQPLNEPVARGGPFVMNTAEEIRQAFDDFKNNRFQETGRD